ncbi:uncharacterized protein EV422DRAFT_568382 [Fimicolochytrium jonesii]|uniref:uncharacterized protein n=1 Tax=Fimicolochytrium jonesii TaxID=1396493 RepID=UPI0022FDD1B8|nr:uncharacterized protein EV422DRAFT_568382 [Fimicolochytrium jonesii]KAI8819931.1 hypothetical protein EV422DRAFT_568382 [Fimicolochytrium jonesii]
MSDQLESFAQIYAYPPFSTRARTEKLCRSVMSDPELYARIARSMRVILPRQLLAPDEQDDEQRRIIRDSLRYRIPVYFGRICSQSFNDDVLLRVCGYTAAEGHTKILPKCRYVVCGRVLATSPCVDTPKPAYVAHAWGINFETSGTWDYSHYMDSEGRILRDTFETTQRDMCRMIVRAGEHALHDAGAGYVDLLVPMIGMGVFMQACRSSDDRSWALNTLVQQLHSAVHESTAEVRVIFYGDTRIKPLPTSPKFTVKLGGDMFADAGELLATSACVCVVNAWDPVSFIGNGMAHDRSIDGMIGSGMGYGAGFANSCFTHNTYLMPAVLDRENWIGMESEAAGMENDNAYLAPADHSHLPAHWRVGGVSGCIVKSPDPYTWTLRDSHYLLDQQGHAWDVYSTDRQHIDYVVSWHRFNGGANQRFEIEQGGVTHRGLYAYIDAENTLRLTPTASQSVALRFLPAPTGPTPAFWTQLPAQLPYPLFYLSEQQAPVLANHPDLEAYTPYLPCWVPQALISTALFGSAETVAQTQRARGTAWVWATEFSNVHSTFEFTEPPITVDGETYPGGPEVYFQLMKYHGTPAFDLARQALTPDANGYVNPSDAFAVGLRWALRDDWTDVREGVMEKAVRAKFEREELRELLKSTGTHPLVQLKPGDGYWGTGGDGRGGNVLGVILERGLVNIFILLWIDQGWT